MCLYSLLIPEFPNSGDEDAFYPPKDGTFRWEIYSVLSGGPGRVRGPSCTYYFLSD